MVQTVRFPRTGPLLRLPAVGSQLAAVPPSLPQRLLSIFLVFFEVGDEFSSSMARIRSCTIAAPQLGSKLTLSLAEELR
jgi:hypothetical protein